MTKTIGTPKGRPRQFGQRVPMSINLLADEMDALWKVHKQTGISRNELIRRACIEHLRQYQVHIEIPNAPAREKKIPPSDRRPRHRHAREFMEMSLNQLMEGK